MNINRWHPKSELVIQMLADGYSYKEIRAKLNINSDETIRRIKRRSHLPMLQRTPKPRRRYVNGLTMQLPLPIEQHYEQPAPPATWQQQAIQALAKWAQMQGHGFTTNDAMQTIKAVQPKAPTLECRQIINACVAAGHFIRSGYRLIRGKEESYYCPAQGQQLMPGLCG